MRTAAEFDSFYAMPDPWRLSQAKFRDRVLRRRLNGTIRGRSVLELGCGEGHLTQVLFREVRNAIGVDISEVAIQRAQSRGLPNALFESLDFMKISFEGHDVIAAIECCTIFQPLSKLPFSRR
jgi:cyclopropane fatty-acyl-phospholipid synthase-like methyltransferase